jgi:hypothetical protein
MVRRYRRRGARVQYQRVVLGGRPIDERTAPPRLLRATEDEILEALRVRQDRRRLEQIERPLGRIERAER